MPGDGGISQACKGLLLIESKGTLGSKGEDCGFPGLRRQEKEINILNIAGKKSDQDNNKIQKELWFIQSSDFSYECG